MKRLAAIILSTLLLFSFTACDFSNNIDDEISTSEIVQFSPPSWEAPLFSSYDDIRYAIIKLEKYGGIESFESSGIELDAREQEIYDALRSIIGQPLSYSYRDDINSDGINELIIWKNNLGYNSPIAPVAAFGMKDGKPVFLKNVIPSKDELKDGPYSLTEWNGDHYKIFAYDTYRSDDKDIKYEYEIYDKEGRLVKIEQTNARITIGTKNDFLIISIPSSDYTDGYSYRKTVYSISENKFSNVFYDALAFSDDKVVYADNNGVLTVQNIFDKSVFYEQYPEYKYPSSVYFASDGKSISFEYYFENARKPAIKTICFERLPIIKVLYSSIPVFYEPAPDCPVQLSCLLSEWAYLRSATSDTARLLDTEPIKVEWNGEELEYYKILYFDREYYVYASYRVEVTYYGDDNATESTKTKEEVINSVIASFPELSDHNFYAEDVYSGYHFLSPQKGYFFSFGGVADTFDTQLDILLKTEDGGKTWQSISVNTPPQFHWKERVLCAKMLNDSVGLISGGFWADDDITNRTYITTDGGLNWDKIELPYDNSLSGAEVYDFVDEDEYYLCIRVLTGDSYENQRYEYFEYSSLDLKTWRRVDKGGK